MAHVIPSSSNARLRSEEHHAESQRALTQQQQQQQRLYAAYTVVHNVHTSATQLIAEGMTLLAAQYASSTAEGRADESSSPSLDHRRPAEQREMVEDLLLRFTDMQTQLTRTTHSFSLPNHRKEGHTASHKGREEVWQAIQYLESCLPSDWQKVAGIPTATHVKTSDADHDAKLQPQNEQKSKPASSPTPTHVTAADVRDRRESSPISAAPYEDIENGTAAAAAAAPSDALTCPSDIVQLALLLRRHWVLQRDVALSIPALLDVLTAWQKEENKVAAEPLLSVSVALAVMQLSHAQAMFDNSQPLHDESDNTAPLYTSTQRRLLSSSLRPPLTFASATALTTLPLLLWRAWVTKSAPAKNCKAGDEEEQQQQQQSATLTAPQRDSKNEGDEEEEEAASLATASAVAAAHGYATARVTTKLIYKWEAHIAAYASAQLLVVERSAQASYQDSSRSVLVTAADASFLESVLAELSVVRGACNAAQLLWLTLASALHPRLSTKATASTSRRDSQKEKQIVNDAGKRCSKLEKKLHALLSTSLTARLLLPGVLLWLGYTANVHARASADKEEKGPAAAPSSSQCISCWQEAYTQGRQVLGPSHPLVETLADLLSSSSASADVAPTPPKWEEKKTSTSPAPTSLPPIPRRSLPPPQPIAASISTPASSVTALRPLRLCPSPPPPPPPPRTAATPPRPPDFTRAFTTAALTARTSLPSTTSRPIPEKDEPRISRVSVTEAFSSTFPRSRHSMSSGAVHETGGTTAATAAPPLQPRPRGTQPVSTRVKNLAALRNCHRLGNPADAFTLASTVQDVVYEADLAHKPAPARRSGRRKKKGKKDEKASTEALLLSAAAEDSGSSLAETISVSNGDHNQRQRRRRPDRQLLPPLTEVRYPASADPQKRVSQSDMLSPFTQGGQPFWSPSRKDEENRSIEGVAASSAGQRTRKNTLSTANNSPSVHSNNNNDASVSMGNNDGEQGENEEEDDEEKEDDDYDDETLPERNARLQREIRTFFAQLNERRVRAAGIIQRAWRCSRARQLLQARQQMLYRYVYIIQKAAALALESFVLCVWEQRKRRAALESRRNADAKRRVQERREVAAAQVLTRAARRWGARQRERRRLREQLDLARDAQLRQYEATAVLVQRWWRTVQPRKAYWRRRNEAIAAQQRAHAEADRLARAATIIQKRVRGMQTRARTAELRRMQAAATLALQLKRDAAVTVLMTVLQEHVRRQARRAREAAAQQTQQEDAVQRIAAGWQATMARRRLDVAVQRARQLRTSATAIQHAWRRYVAGRQRRYLRQVRRTLQEERLARELHLSTSLLRLQCAARGALDEWLVFRLKARVGRTFIESVLLLQVVCRAGQVRQALGQARLVAQAQQQAEAARQEQQRLHAAHSVQATLRGRQSALLVQQRRLSRLREKLRVYTAVTREMREDAAASVVQRAVRRHQQRQHAAAAAAETAAALAYLHHAARCMQQAWRAHASRRERRRRAAAVQRAAVKRQEQEEVWELIWRDQKRELEVLCTLEQHYIAEAEHAARLELYRNWMSPSKKQTAKLKQEPAVTQCESSEVVDRWAALYFD